MLSHAVAQLRIGIVSLVNFHTRNLFHLPGSNFLHICKVEVANLVKTLASATAVLLFVTNYFVIVTFPPTRHLRQPISRYGHPTRPRSNAPYRS